jgi:anti-sigma-K factor RskA
MILAVSTVAVVAVAAAVIVALIALIYVLPRGKTPLNSVLAESRTDYAAFRAANNGTPLRTRA